MFREVELQYNREEGFDYIDLSLRRFCVQKVQSDIMWVKVSLSEDVSVVTKDVTFGTLQITGILG